MLRALSRSVCLVKINRFMYSPIVSCLDKSVCKRNACKCNTTPPLVCTVKVPVAEQTLFYCLSCVSLSEFSSLTSSSLKQPVSVRYAENPYNSVLGITRSNQINESAPLNRHELTFSEALVRPLPEALNAMPRSPPTYSTINESGEL